MVEARGRTGRKPTAAEKGGKPARAASGREKRLERYDRPPTWRGAFYKAMFAAVALLLVSLLLLKQSASAIGLFPIVLGGYTLISYYTDLWLYRRRQRTKQRASRRETAR